MAKSIYIITNRPYDSIKNIVKRLSKQGYYVLNGTVDEVNTNSVVIADWVLPLPINLTYYKMM